MPRVGIRELKNDTSEIIRAVREDHVEYVVTHHGRPVAMLLPVEPTWLQAEQDLAIRAAQPSAEILAELEALRAEIDQNWRSDKTAVELISEGRR